MPTIWGRNYQLNELKSLWAPVYEGTLALIGSTGIILPFGDPDHGQPDAATFTTLGEEELTFTWSEAPGGATGFDNKLDLTSRDSYQGLIPFIDFNGTDEEADSPDNDYWSRDDASAEAWSVGLWIAPDNKAADGQLLTKTNFGNAEEWYLVIKSNETIKLGIVDESAGVEAARQSDAALTVGEWAHIVVTYDGAGGATAADTIIIYKNGAVFVSTATNNGSYVAMENLAHPVGLASYSSSGEEYDGKMAGGPCGPFFTQTVLSADTIKRLYNLQRKALGV